MPKTFRKFGLFCGSMPPDTFFVKPSSHMPPKYLQHSHWYCLRYHSNIRGHNGASNKKHRRSFKPSASQQSRTRVNFAGIMAVKTDMASVAGDFCSHIRTVSQAVQASMSQVARQHMRTRLYAPKGNSIPLQCKQSLEAFQIECFIRKE